MRTFSHLTFDQRKQIEKMLAVGNSALFIAAAIGVHNTTIYREIKRGLTDEGIYCAELAERNYREALSKKGCPAIFTLEKELAAFVIDRLNNGFSPKEIEEELKGLDQFPIKVTHCTIYNAIDSGVLPTPKNYHFTIRGKRKLKAEEKLSPLKALVVQRMKQLGIENMAVLLKKMRSKMSEKSFETKLNDPDDFSTKELKQLASCLYLSDNEILKIVK